MIEDGNILAVEAVDKLMMQYRHRVTPTDHDLVKAYELGINVQALKTYIEEFELEQETDADWTEDCNESGW